MWAQICLGFQAHTHTQKYPSPLFILLMSEKISTFEIQKQIQQKKGNSGSAGAATGIYEFFWNLAIHWLTGQDL